MLLLHTQQSPVAIHHVEAVEWQRVEGEKKKKKSDHRDVEVALFASIHSPFIQAADPFRRRRQVRGRLHRNHLPWSCDGESCDVMQPEEASRLSVVVNECKLRVRVLPAPPLPAASHNYRLLPSSWHADVSDCLNGMCVCVCLNRGSHKHKQHGIHCSAMLGDIKH